MALTIDEIRGIARALQRRGEKLAREVDEGEITPENFDANRLFSSIHDILPKDESRVQRLNDLGQTGEPLAGNNWCDSSC